MLLVKTHLSADKFGGIGLFASQEISKGAVVWEWNDSVEKVFTKSEFQSLPEQFKKFLLRYGYSPDGENVVLNLDDSRFFNHSDEPNTIEEEIGIITAVKDIQIGEEITCNYLVFDKDKKFCSSFLEK